MLELTLVERELGKKNTVWAETAERLNGKRMRGVGATPEGIENNPVMFELLYELPWRAERFSPDRKT